MRLIIVSSAARFCSTARIWVVYLVKPCFARVFLVALDAETGLLAHHPFPFA